MSPLPHRRSRRRTIWTSILERTCFGFSSSSDAYTSISTDSLPLLSEKITFYPTVQPSPKAKPLPSSPPRLTRWPSASNLKTRRSILHVSTHNVATGPPPDERSSAASFDPKTRSRNGTTPEIELVDEPSLVDAANLSGAVSGPVEAGYAGAAYHQQRVHGQEERRKDEDVEKGQKPAITIGITIESRQSEQQSRQEEHRVEERRDEEFVWTGMR
ncbi:hypothetical protein G7Y79_00028g062130 [Physcia stellaris]|nr:hypothetical protein G7Y79_00028g062130 [Physcia stellaris]